MSAYATRQREALGDYLQSLADEHVSAEEIVEHFARAGAPIGRATVYRYLRQLEQDGFVRRYVTDNRKASCFQYLGAREAVRGREGAGAREHFHLQCESCGTLQHVECHTLTGMEEHLRQSHDFSVNPLRTVLYGICHDCMTTGEKGNNP